MQLVLNVGDIRRLPEAANLTACLVGSKVDSALPRCTLARTESNSAAIFG